jgi:hypothetical protein
VSARRVAVIGGGAAGLVAARELLRAGHAPLVFEQAARIGGAWVYDPLADDDPSGRHVNQPVFSSIYASLRTNLPKDLMAFLDYPFDASGGGEDDWPRFPHHSLVLTYLERFCRDFHLQDCLRLNHQVTSVRPAGSAWQVISSTDGKASRPMDFDAVMVCNGHYSHPRVPELPGLEHFRGRIIHSHNYRDASAFSHQRVVLWGAAASGTDISREIATTATSVDWCGAALAGRYPTGSVGGVRTRAEPIGFDRQGNLLLSDQQVLTDIDTFMFCTGYEYRFPFLSRDIVNVQDNWVRPLYQELVVPRHPTLAFIGLPYLVVPFPLFEIQARWFARCLAGQFDLPSQAQMEAAQEARLQQFRHAGVKTRHYHKLAEKQTEYLDQLCAQCGEPPVPDWFSELTSAAQQARLANPENFREEPF